LTVISLEAVTSSPSLTVAVTVTVEIVSPNVTLILLSVIVTPVPD
jgi:hypothetical protein